MPIDMLGAFFPPPIATPERPHRIEKSDRDGRTGRHIEAPHERRRHASDDPENQADGDDADDQDSPHISVEA